MQKDGTSEIMKHMAVLLPILAGVCWGIAGIFVRVLEEEGLDNPTIVFTRTSVGTILMFCYLFFTDREKLKMRPRDLPVVAAISLIASVLLMMAYNYAVMHLSLSMAAILLCLAPVFVLLISSPLYGEQITGKKVVCMICAFAGCAMLSGIFETGIVIHGTGILMGLASALFNAIYILLSKYIAGRGYSSFTVTLYTSLIATIILAFFTDWGALGSYLSSSPVSAAGILAAQSVCSSLIPSIAYIAAMKYVEAGRTAILESGAEPASAMLAGLLLFHEIPSVIGILGMIVTVIALSVLAADKEGAPR